MVVVVLLVFVATVNEGTAATGAGAETLKLTNGIPANGGGASSAVASAAVVVIIVVVAAAYIVGWCFCFCFCFYLCMCVQTTN